jgi:hypothetical protein
LKVTVSECVVIEHLRKEVMSAWLKRQEDDERE